MKGFPLFPGILFLFLLSLIPSEVHLATSISESLSNVGAKLIEVELERSPSSLRRSIQQSEVVGHHGYQLDGVYSYYGERKELHRYRIPDASETDLGKRANTTFDPLTNRTRRDYVRSLVMMNILVYPYDGRNSYDLSIDNDDSISTLV